MSDNPNRRSGITPSDTVRTALPTVRFHYGPLDDPLPFDIAAIDQTGAMTVADYPHRHDFYELLFVTQGEGFHIVDFNSIPIQPPVLFFLSPGQVHFWNIEKSISGELILFEKEFMNFGPSISSEANWFPFFDDPRKCFHGPLAPRQADRIAAHFDGLKTEFRAGTFSRATALFARLHLLLVDIQRIVDEEAPVQRSRETSSLCSRFLNLLSKNGVAQHGVKYYARQLGISAGHLSDIVHKGLGKPPGQIIQDRIVLEARRQLTHSRRTVAEIAADLHFEDPSYFGRFFRRQTGQSPARFRTESRRKYGLSD